MIDARHSHHQPACPNAAHARFDTVCCFLVAGWIAIVALTPISYAETLTIEAVLFCFAAGFANVDFAVLFRRWAGMVVTVLFLALFVAMGHPARREIGWAPLVAGIVLKNGILLATVVALVEKVGQFRILAELARLGLPGEIVSTIGTMARYGPVLADQNRRMKRARKSRMIRNSLPGLWLVQSGGLSTLLSTTLKRSERIHAAMLARGWQNRRVDGQKVNAVDAGPERGALAESASIALSATEPGPL